MKKKWICAVLAVLQILCYLPTFGFAEEGDTPVLLPVNSNFTAQMEVGEDGAVFENMNAPVDAMQVVERDGRHALMLDPASGNTTYFQINIDDKIAFDMPDNTPIDVTIEYYDDAEGLLEINYDGHHPVAGDWLGELNISTKPVIKLKGTKEWKSETIRFYDLKMANRIDEWIDLRIGVYAFTQGAFSASPVPIGAIRVTKQRPENPLALKDRGPSEPGGIYELGEEISFDMRYLNESEEKVTATFTAEAYRGDAYAKDDELLWSGDLGEVTWEAKQEGGPSFTLPKEIIDRYGFYHIRIKKNFHYESTPDEVIETEDTIEFSRAWKLKPEEGNERLGTAMLIPIYNWAENDISHQQAVDMGVTWIREQIDWGGIEYPKGTYKIPDAWRASLQKAHDLGLKIEVGIVYGNVQYGFVDQATGVGSWNVFPKTQEEIEAYGDYAAWLVKELKGIVQAVGIWNEPNLVGFNANNETPEHYVEVLKSVYPKIKAANPDVLVLGPECAGGLYPVETTWVERVLAAGGAEYLDVITNHPYDWGTEFSPQTSIDAAKYNRDIMAKYGAQDKLRWNTETGFGRPQYLTNNQDDVDVMYYMLMYRYNMFDKWLQFRFCDGGLDPVAAPSEVYFGFTYDPDIEDEPLRPAAAKPSYLAYCTMNHLIGDYAELKHDLTIDQNYAFHYYNPRRDEDIFYIQNHRVNTDITMDLGCPEVTVYDTYGNTEKMYAEDGIYTFSVTKKPQYIGGHFQKFEKLDNASATVYADEFAITGVPGDQITYTFHAPKGTDLQIEVAENDSLHLVENKGFQNGTAKLVFDTDYETAKDTTCAVKMRDAKGVLQYQTTLYYSIADPITVSVNTSSYGKSSTRWRIEVGVKNNSNSQTIGGTITMTAPEREASRIKPRDFHSLKPGQEITVYLSLPERITQTLLNTKVEVKLDNGYETYFERKLDFTKATYAYTKPIIDGIRGTNEWSGIWFGSDAEADYGTDNFVGWNSWEGPQDLSYNATIMWDEDYLYLFANIVDDVMYANYQPQLMWMGDSIQWGIDDRIDENPVAVGTYAGFDMAITTEGKKMRRELTYHPHDNVDIDCELEICRYDGYTIYEAKIPWSEVFYEGFVPTEGQQLRFSMAVNDADAKNRGWMVYNEGIINRKNLTDFGWVTLEK